MLKEFRIGNYRSFKNEVVFTMEADMDGVSEHSNHVFTDEYGNNLLRLASLYGPNAGGKTNFIYSILFARSLLLNRYSQSKVNEIGFSKKQIIFPQFAFTDEIDSRISVGLYFIDENYEYGIECIARYLHNNNNAFALIDEETFVYRPLDQTEFKTLYTRSGNIIESNSLKNELDLSAYSISNDKPYSFFLYDNFVKKGEINSTGLDLINRFYSQINKIVMYRPLQEDVYLFNFVSAQFKAFGNKYMSTIIAFLNDLGINIKDIKINPLGNDDVYCIHDVDGKDYRLNWRQESEGTRKLILMLLSLFQYINNNAIFLIDEIDAHLHPKLTAKIIGLINADPQSQAQLIFTSHDIWNMNNDNFRRDEIWFVCRNKKLESELYCLSDFIDFKGEKVRKDAKYSKQYMESKYGADPFVAKGFGMLKDIKKEDVNQSYDDVDDLIDHD